MLLIGSIVLATGQLVGTGFISRGRLKAGFWWMLCYQPVAVSFNIFTTQYGFVILGVLATIMYASGLRKLHEEARRQMDR